uniref:G10 protein n=1 Tax=Dunaliella tertiolecta TaxID=3047 RepID=A0A7S3R2P4_DUNTE|eukprot:CAMPEP_0202362006 /NCGR_PEP_ID=MMETSP1126-20121109/14343_1 /ASSEMBLY_ACC=CAM_ASM_000457 /TAXON_ID=3047 /ORGANISM="Dunaliella tertiolecta, Strain CCMP1320" /LENGTH=226 /DNA_ID=CAMNT_0048956075 /DNA_START=34 /DNA_END=714 /DNA_ORIENTATION=-
MSSTIRRKLKNKKPPPGWELIEEVIEDFETQMKEAVNEEHEGKRKNELTWKIHRLHWEKNRFIFDLMYQRKVMSRELYDYLVREKIADGALISKWRKPGYEILCSMLAIQKGNHNFGTTSHCRVPLRVRSNQQKITPDVQTGCISCASGDGRFGGPIWWNTPLDEEGGGAEENTTRWQQPGVAPSAEAGPSREGGGRKRGADDLAEDDDDMPEDVKRRLAMLQGKA